MSLGTMKVGGENLDTFDNMAPVDLPNEEVVSSQPHNPNQAVVTNDQGQGMDTFENMEVKGLEEEKTEEEPKKADSTQALDEEEVEEKAEEKEEEEKVEAKEETEEEEETAPEEKPEVDIKTIRLKNGDKVYDVDPEATVPVRVRGKKQFVPLEELRANYSGKVAYDEKFSEIQAKEEKVIQERDSYMQEKEEIAQHLGIVGQRIKAALEDPQADPIDPLRYLVDMAGGDVLQFEKVLVDKLLPRLLDYQDMDDVERSLYWTKKENEFLKNNQANRAEVERSQLEKQRETQQVSKLRESYGVSESEFKETHTRLLKEGFDPKSLTPEAVCKFHVYLPFVEKTEAILKENGFDEELGDDEYSALTQETARVMYDYQHLSDVEALKIAAKKLGYEIEDVEDDIRDLNEKVMQPKTIVDPTKKGKTKGKVAQVESEGHVETFDDFNTYNYSPSRY